MDTLNKEIEDLQKKVNKQKENLDKIQQDINKANDKITNTDQNLTKTKTDIKDKENLIKGINDILTGLNEPPKSTPGQTEAASKEIKKLYESYTIKLNDYKKNKGLLDVKKLLDDTLTVLREDFALGDDKLTPKLANLLQAQLGKISPPG